MKNQKDDLVHLRFEYVDALNAVRDILYIEKSLITISKNIMEYNSSKNEEAKIKIKLREKASAAKRILEKLQKKIPKVKSPKMGKIHEERKIEEITSSDDSIERQLQDIQSKLSSLANQKF